ncbi:MAG: DUF5050 domain-containing protein [Polyangiaceae bacterium]
MLATLFAGVALLVQGCTQALGVEDRNYEGGGGGGGASGGGASGGAGGGDCVDLLHDEHNCGACGHDCLGGACDTGQCQPFVVSTTPSASALSAIKCDPGPDGEVYWSRLDEGAVFRVPKSGGEAEMIFANSNWVRDIALDADDVFFSTRDDAGSGAQEIGYYRIERSTLAQAELLPAQVGPAWVAIDDDFLFFSNSGGQIGRIPKIGGDPETVVAGPIDAAITLADGWLYYANSQHVSRVRIDGTDRTDLYDHEPGYAEVVGVHGGNVYWWADFQAHRAPIDGSGVATTLFPAETTRFQFIDGYVYFRSGSDLLRVREDVVVPTFDDLEFVALTDVGDPLTNDGVSLIWGEHFSGKIYRLAL